MPEALAFNFSDAKALGSGIADAQVHIYHIPVCESFITCTCAGLISWRILARSCGARLVSFIIAGSCGAWLVSERQSTLILKSINFIEGIGWRRRRLWRRTLVCRVPARRCGKTINATRHRRRETGALAEEKKLRTLAKSYFGIMTNAYPVKC